MKKKKNCLDKTPFLKVQHNLHRFFLFKDMQTPPNLNKLLKFKAN